MTAGVPAKSDAVPAPGRAGADHLPGAGHAGRAGAGQLLRRTLWVLVASQVLGGIGVAGGIAVGSLLAEELSGSASLAGLAQTASVLGAALMAVPLARLMQAFGRRPGLAAGYGTGALGAVVVLVAAQVQVFALLLVGMLLFGAATAAGLQSRYAATDLAPAAARGRSLALVVWATTVGAVAGPNTVGPASAAGVEVGLPPLAGSFAFSLTAFVVAALVLVVFLRPDPLIVARSGSAPGGNRGVRPTLRTALSAVRRVPAARLGLLAVTAAHTVMVGVMVMTPVHLAHGGTGLRVIGIVISVHIAGMYALSPVVGWLTDRLGRVPMILVGAAVLFTALVLAGGAAAHDARRLGIGLFLLGVGWSCGLIAGSTLLSETVPAEVRPAVQGAADLVMGVAGALGGALAGLVVGTAGYGVLNVAAVAVLLPVAVVAASEWRARHVRVEVS